MEIISYPSFNRWGGLLEELSKLEGFEELIQTREDLQKHIRNLKLLEEAKTPEELSARLKTLSVLDRNYLNSVLLDRLCEVEEESYNKTVLYQNKIIFIEPLNVLYTAMSKNYIDCIEFLLRIYPLNKKDKDAQEYLDSLPADIKKIDISRRGIIRYLPNLDRFTQLEEFNCNHNGLFTLPALPNSLKILKCYYNDLTVLPTLPNSLQHLGCESNKLTTLPALPNSLQSLACSENNIIVLPALPDSLQILYCGDNNLTALPALPDSLRELYCASNKLITFPTLPNSLEILYCPSNGLIALPTLPPLLRKLHCSFNKLTTIPALPNSLQMLRLQDNKLTALPIVPPNCDYLN